MAPSSKDDDARAFEEAVRGARPLSGRPKVTGQPDPPEPGRPVRARPAPSRDPMIVEVSGETVAGRRHDVGADVIRQLRTGGVAIEAQLDLHGRTLDEALRALERFVIAARGHGQRVVLVIHGRGLGSDASGPVLRPAVWGWLRGAAAARAGVLAFVTAPARQGGSGATLLRLSK